MYYNGAISALNTLVDINFIRIEKYFFACRKTAEKELTILFDKMVETSRIFNSSLIFEIHKLGGTPPEDVLFGFSIPELIEPNDLETTPEETYKILSRCISDEKKTMKAYFHALNNDLENLTPGLIILIKSQNDKLKNENLELQNLLFRIKDKGRKREI